MFSSSSSQIGGNGRLGEKEGSASWLVDLLVVALLLV